MGAEPIGSHGSYEPILFETPHEVRLAAYDGLVLHNRYRRGGTHVGIARAKQLWLGSPKVTLRDLVYMRSYFRRHAVDRLDLKDPPSNGWIAWQLWGGYAAQRWAEETVHKYARQRSNPTLTNYFGETSQQPIDWLFQNKSQLSGAEIVSERGGGCVMTFSLKQGGTFQARWTNIGVALGWLMHGAFRGMPIVVNGTQMRGSDTRHAAALDYISRMSVR